MSTVVGLGAAIFLFGAGCAAGWRAAGANQHIDRLLSLFRRDVEVNDEADMGEQR
jgi:hypothetical protein